jgi:hypothetical protein
MENTTPNLDRKVCIPSQSGYTLSLSRSDPSTCAWLLDLQRLRLDSEAVRHLSMADPTQAGLLENGTPFWRLDLFQNLTVNVIEHRSTSADPSDELTAATEFKEGRQHEYLAVAISVPQEESFRWLKLERLAKAGHPSVCECIETISVFAQADLSSRQPLRLATSLPRHFRRHRPRLRLRRQRTRHPVLHLDLSPPLALYLRRLCSRQRRLLGLSGLSTAGPVLLLLRGGCVPDPGARLRRRAPGRSAHCPSGLLWLEEGPFILGRTTVSKDFAQARHSADEVPPNPWQHGTAHRPRSGGQPAGTSRLRAADSPLIIPQEAVVSLTTTSSA